jgi:hypothetical protein
VRKVFNLAPDQDWRYTWVQELPNVIPPPAKFDIDSYYTKFTWAREFTVAGNKASEEALLAANGTIRKMFAYRHDILKALISDGAKLVVLGKGESLADLPELQESGESIDLLARFLDYDPEHKLVVVDETNVLADPDVPLVGQNQVIRGMARAFFVLTSERPIDPDWEDRGRQVQQYELRVKRLDVTFGDKVKELYGDAIEEGRWSGTASVHSPAEYWAQAVTAYFEATGQAAAPNGAAHPIGTRSLLESYDQELYKLVNETMAYDGHLDWRYEHVGSR